MRRGSNRQFTAIHSEGGLLPSDLLQRIVAGDRSLPGLDPASYHLGRGERLNEAIARSWNRIRAAWQGFTEALKGLSDADPAIGLTRERWLGIIFQELHYGRLPRTSGLEIDGKQYPVSHMWGDVPIHLVGYGVDLDRRTPGVAGAARSSPHGLLQEFINRSEQHLWGIVSNGRKLRLLRDNVSLTRQSYVEFDLESIMEGESYPDFSLFWLLCHESRLEGDKPNDSWLERWVQIAQEQGARALNDLRDAVEKAVETLGAGFVKYPGNHSLKQKLREGHLTGENFKNQLLRLVYRLMFLFVAEDRDLLHPENSDPNARELYADYYSTARLRKQAERSRGSKHPDLYRSLRVVMKALESDQAAPVIGLTPMGGGLWAADCIPELMNSDLANADFLSAIRRLAFMSREGVRMAVDYKNIGSEEIGGIYESLLELMPELNTESGSFRLVGVSGNSRKTTGSYYTNPALVQCLLDSALEPILQEAALEPNPEEAILSLKVCDPACGSGAFLIAAAHRIARKLAALRTGDEEPSPEEVRRAVRDVIGRCIYGVDLNPMAVELCKINLWMEAMDKGKPVSFLDHRIQVGNSLLGTVPALMEQGIPNEAFTAILGDDKRIASEWRRQNREERENPTVAMFVADGDRYVRSPLIYPMEQSADIINEIDVLPNDDVDQVERKRTSYRALTESSAYKQAKLIADAWCAAFVWPKTKDATLPITNATYEAMIRNPDWVSSKVREEIEGLTEQYKFFHWHIAFPDVFRLPDSWEKPDNPKTGCSGGFDVVLGNPPWEQIEVQETEWFASRRPNIAEALNAASRNVMIQDLKYDDTWLYELFINEKRKHEGIRHFLANSGRYPLCGRGRINTYSVFAEVMQDIISPTGRVGAVIPSGIATDHTTRFFFQEIMGASGNSALISFYDFENRQALFPGVHRSYKFSLLTMTGRARPARGGTDFVFFAEQVEDLADPDRHVRLTMEDIRLINPNTLTVPIFRSRKDAEVTRMIHQSAPVLIREPGREGFEENPWGMSFRQGLFNMAADSSLFRTWTQLEDAGWSLEGNVFTKDEKRYLPLYEAKMIHHCDHRWATYSRDGKTTRDMTAQEKVDPARQAMPRYWVPEEEVEARLKGRWDKQWLMGWRDICRSTDERTVIAGVMPRVGVGHTFPLFFTTTVSESELLCLLANLSSFALDYCARQKIGGTHLTYGYLKQLPVLPPSHYAQSAPWAQAERLVDWISQRVIELLCTANDLKLGGDDLGWQDRIFTWNDERRFLLRCELDAAFFHLYDLHRGDAEYILDTFPIVRRKDENAYGEYRTKRLVLSIYDQMAEAMTGLEESAMGTDSSD